MELLKGKPLWCLTEKEVEAIDFTHWRDLIQKLQHGIKIGYRPIDISTNNVFWSEEGFKLIDVGLYEKNHPEKLHTPLFFKEYAYFARVYEKLRPYYEFDETCQLLPPNR